jgi:hypothetical protein
MAVGFLIRLSIHHANNQGAEVVCRKTALPTCFLHTRNYTFVTQLTKADATQGKLAVHSARPPAQRTTTFAATAEFRLTIRFFDLRFTRHDRTSLLDTKRHSQLLQEQSAFVVSGRRCYQGNVHPLNIPNFVCIDFGKD